MEDVPTAQVVKWDGIPGWDSVASGSPGSQEEQGGLRAAEFPGIGMGKPVAKREPRCRFLLNVAINCQRQHSGVTVLGAGAQHEAKPW